MNIRQVFSYLAVILLHVGILLGVTLYYNRTDVAAWQDDSYPPHIITETATISYISLTTANITTVEETTEITTTTSFTTTETETTTETTTAEVPRVINTNIYSASGLTAEEYNQLIYITLHNNNTYDASVMTDIGQALYEVEQENSNINGLLILAIASQESGWGRSHAAKSYNNLTGIMSQGGLKSFDTVSECITYVGELLSNNYIAEGRNTTTSIGQKYCPDEYDEWASAVNYIMDIYISNLDEI